MPVEKKKSRTCKQCGKVCTWRTSRFCSFECQRQSKKLAKKSVKKKPSKIRKKKRVRSMKIIDSLFSLYIRTRDGRCLYCGTTDNLQCSHVVPRSKSQFLRWNEDNAITLCYKDHIMGWHKDIKHFSAWYDTKFPGMYEKLNEIARTSITKNRNMDEEYEKIKEKLELLK